MSLVHHVILPEESNVPEHPVGGGPSDLAPAAHRATEGDGPDVLGGLRTTEPARRARACRARAVVLDLEGHPEEAQRLRDLADVLTDPTPGLPRSA